MNGATFISTHSADWIELLTMLCQCPEWGDLHFYQIIPRRKDNEQSDCVNALNGATFISTLASGNPHK